MGKRGDGSGKGGWAGCFVRGGTHNYTLVLLNLLTDCSSWWEEEAAPRPTLIGWQVLTAEHRKHLKDQ